MVVLRIMVGFLLLTPLYNYPMEQKKTPYFPATANSTPVNRSMYTFDLRYRRYYDLASSPQTNPYYRDQLSHYEQKHPNRHLHALVNHCGYIATGCLTATVAAAGAAMFFYVLLQNVEDLDS